jgi:hypothetical protein
MAGMVFLFLVGLLGLGLLLMPAGWAMRLNGPGVAKPNYEKKLLRFSK